MHWLVATVQDPIVVGGALVAAGLALALLIQRRRGRSAPAACSARARLLEPNERALLETLQAATGPDIEIWPQVHAGAVLTVGEDAPRRQRRRAAQLLARQRFDFVVVSGEGHPLAAIRCARAGGGSSRADLKAMCAHAGLALVVLDPNASYAVDALREHLQWHMRGPAGEAEADVDAEGRREPVIDLPPE